MSAFDKPDLKQILQDLEEGKIVSRVFIKEAIKYAVDLEERFPKEVTWRPNLSSFQYEPGGPARLTCT